MFEVEVCAARLKLNFISPAFFEMSDRAGAGEGSPTATVVCSVQLVITHRGGRVTLVPPVVLGFHGQFG